MKFRISLLFCFMPLGWICAQDSLNLLDAENTRYPIAFIGEKNLPPEATFNGRFMGGWKWEDKTGENLLRFYETIPVEVPLPSGELQHRAFLAVSRFVHKGKSWKPVWNFVDTEICSASRFEVHFSPASFTLTDIDQNGTVEICFLYTLVCQDTLTPVPKMLILYEGENKYKIIGETELILPQGRTGGEFTLDSGLLQQEFLRDFAVRRWKSVKGN